MAMPFWTLRPSNLRLVATFLFAQISTRLKLNTSHSWWVWTRMRSCVGKSDGVSFQNMEVV